MDEIKQILRQKTEALNFPLNSRVTEFLLETFSHNIKQVNQALQALILRTHLAGNNSKGGSLSLNTPQVKQLLKDLILEQEQAALTPQKIIQIVAEYFGIRTEDILGRAQTRECVLPRQMAMYLCRQQVEWPFMKIGELFGRDHSTVMSSVKAIEKALEKGVVEVHTPYQAILKKLLIHS
jgi:chromosomal replication initiator protein